MIEMAIAREEHEIVLQDERRDPEVVGRYRSALSSKLPVDGGMVMRGLIVGEQDQDPVLAEEGPQHAFIFRASPAQAEARRVQLVSQRVVERAAPVPST